jgi:aspartate aminotransferase
MFKKIVKNLEPSSTLKINEISKELEDSGKEIFKFGFGQSPFEIPTNIVSALKDNANHNIYLPMQGMKKLREVIAKHVSKKKTYEYTSENIIIGPGTKELMFLLQILFDGEILLPAPSWVSYYPQATLGRNKVHWIQTKRENNWFPTAQEIEEVVSKNKETNYLLFLNSPNNPSGLICNNLEEISSIVKKYNILILSDEIYSELTFESSFKSISNFCPEKTIISDGLSKWCAAGGWRLGYFVIPKNLNLLMEKIKVLASETFSSVSAPIQYAAITAYNSDQSEYLKKARTILKGVGNYIYEILKSNNTIVNKPDGGFYLMPEFVNKNFSSSCEMCNDILVKTGVALLPGTDFGLPPEKMIARLSFTDFDGKKFMQNLKNNTKVDENLLRKFAPKIVEGTKRLKGWVEST